MSPLKFIIDIFYYNTIFIISLQRRKYVWSTRYQIFVRQISRHNFLIQIHAYISLVWSIHIINSCCEIYRLMQFDKSLSNYFYAQIGKYIDFQTRNLYIINKKIYILHVWAADNEITMRLISNIKQWNIATTVRQK